MRLPGSLLAACLLAALLAQPAQSQSQSYSDSEAKVWSSTNDDKVSAQLSAAQQTMIALARKTSVEKYSEDILVDVRNSSTRKLTEVVPRKAQLLQNIPADEGTCPSTETVPSYFGMLNMPKNFITHKISFRSCINHHNDTAIADITGPGAVTQFWLVTGIGQQKLRPKMCVWTGDALTLMIRVFVDGEATPRIEVPLGPLFGVHHDVGENWGNTNPYGADNNVYKISENGAFTLVAPIPFSKSCRITVQDETTDLSTRMRIWSQVNYHAFDPRCPMPEKLRLSAAYRIQDRFAELVTPKDHPEHYKRSYVVGHGQGRGFLLGATFGFILQDPLDWWFHNSGELLILDHLTNPRVLKGTGGEDMFLTSCWFHNHHNFPDWGFQSGDNKNKFSAYRWYVGDMHMPFESSFQFQYGLNRDFVESVMYWYQDVPPLPADQRYPLQQRLRQEPVDPSLRANPPTGEIAYWNYTGQYESRLWTTSHHLEQAVHFDHWTFVRPSFGFATVGEYYFAYGSGNQGFPAQSFIWARAFYESPEARDVRLMITHDDPIDVYLNDFLVYSHSSGSLPGFHSFDVLSTLDAGHNVFVVKLRNEQNNNARAYLFGLNLFFGADQMKPQHYHQEMGRIVDVGSGCA